MGEQLELPFVPPLDPRISRRASVLRTAEEYITKDRASTHGNMEDNFSTIATYWSTHLGTPVTPVDVSVMMTLLVVGSYLSARGPSDGLRNARL